MIKSNEKNEQQVSDEIPVGERWHWNEVAKRTGYSVDYVKKVVYYCTRTNEIIEMEYARVVRESQARTEAIKLARLLHL